MRLLIALLLVAMMNTKAAGLSPEEFLAKSAEERIQILRGKPERVLDDPSQILKIYTASLLDASLAVRQTAANASMLLVSGLQSAKPRGKLPAFSESDSAAFQQALVKVLNSDDANIREFSALALAYSAAPNAAIEALLLDQVKAEPVPKIKAAVIEAMAQAGYHSPQLVVEATALVQPNADSKAIYSASQVLAHLRPEAALDTLIALASKASPSQQHALQALAAYGPTAVRASPMLEKLVSDQTMPEDIRNLARITLEAIKAGKPQPSNLQSVSPVNLWPVALSASAPAAPATPAAKRSPTPTTPAPQVASTPSPSTTPIAQTPPASVERKAPVWPWLVGIAAVIAFVTFVAKRRR